MKPITDYQSLDELYADPSPLDTEEGLGLQMALSQVGGWRGLFDPLSSQWKQSKLTDKAGVLAKIQKFLECNFDKIVWMWVKDCIGPQKNTYWLDGLPIAVHELSAEYRPAEDYITRCKHPIFRRFNRAYMEHWKVTLAADIQMPPHLEVTEESLPLLLLS